MKKINTIAMLITNMIMVLYNNYFFPVLEGITNGFHEGWARGIIFWSLIAYIILLPTSLLTRKVITNYIAKTSAGEKKRLLLTIAGIIINVTIMVSIMLSFSQGFLTPQYLEAYTTVVFTCTVNAIIINLLISKPLLNLLKSISQKDYIIS